MWTHNYGHGFVLQLFVCLLSLFLSGSEKKQPFGVRLEQLPLTLDSSFRSGDGSFSTPGLRKPNGVYSQTQPLRSLIPIPLDPAGSRWIPSQQVFRVSPEAGIKIFFCRIRSRTQTNRLMVRNRGGFLSSPAYVGPKFRGDLEILRLGDFYSRVSHSRAVHVGGVRGV